MRVRDSLGRWGATHSPEEDARIIELYEAGYGTTAIAIQLERSKEFVWRRLKAAGVRLRKQGGGHPGHFRFPHRVMERTITLYRAGLSQQEIADAMGLNQSTVRDRLRMFGVEKRSRSEARRLRWQRQKAVVR